MHLFNKDFVLENKSILLRPSVLEDLSALNLIVEPDIWEHTSTVIENEMHLNNYLQSALTDRQTQNRLQLSIFSKKEGSIIGTTSIGNISKENNRVEIGWSWLGKQYQGKGYNQIVKYILLEFLFEVEGINRVEFRTRGSNIKSQNAIKKIGAIKEGVLKAIS